MYLRPLYISPINILKVEREGIGGREIIKKIILLNQSISSNFNLQGQKKFQIKQGIQLLEKHINGPLNEIKSLFISIPVTARIYYMLNTHTKDYPEGYSIEDILELLKKYDITMSRSDFLMYIRPLTNSSINILKVERLGTKENGPIKRILFPEQLILSNNNSQDQKTFQIEQGIQLLEQKTNKSFKTLQTFLKRSTPVARLYYILVTHAKEYTDGYAIEDILELLPKYDITLTRHTLIMYLRSLFNPPLNVLKAEREGVGKSGVVIKKIIL